MSSLIEIDKLIKQAKKEGVSFGRGDPYNRLRYFTKIGWLPHMSRKKTRSGDVTGHYPAWVLERLLLIDKLKKQGLDNDQITNKINTRNKVHDWYSKINTQEFKNKVVSYITLAILFVVLLSELDIVTISKSKSVTIDNFSQTNVPAYIIDSGDSFIPAAKNRVFVKNSQISSSSKVYVTFKQNFSPATRFWVSEIEPQKGFYVELDAPVSDHSEFSWWISK